MPAAPVPPIDFARALAATELFGTLGRKATERLASASEQVSVNGGSALFYQGEQADCVYVVLSGRLRVSLEGADGHERVVGEVGRGEVVGEMALLTGDPRSATVRAVRDTELLRLRKEPFEAVVDQYPEVMLPIARHLVSRLRATMSSAPRPHTTNTIALLPAGRRAPLDAFAGRLSATLAGGGSVLLLTSERVDELLGAEIAQTPQDHARDAELSMWLNEQELQHTFVLYQADTERSAWTVRCLRQADRILLVADFKDDPEPGPVEVAAQRQVGEGPGVEKDLVLIHATSASMYPGTRAWLEPRDVDRLFHVVLDDAANVARLGRLLTGRATGLVLSGGGARGFAEIGVLRALAEAGVAIDMIGGTSMGAHLAAQWTLGWSWERMLEFNRELWAGQRPLKQYNIPLVSLVSGQRLLRSTHKLYGDADIEDMSIPFFCCSSNLTRARLMVHERGSLWRWLGASIAVPGIAPPLLHNGDVLMDGAVLQNLPVDVMRARCPGTVIAVDVSPVEDLDTDPNLNFCPPAWQLALNQLNPFSERLKVPSIFEILSRCASLGSVQNLKDLKAQADVYIHPPTEPFSMFDWDKIVELTEVGYVHAKMLLASTPVAGATKPAPEPADLAQ